jgi:hypothetical protein
MSEKGVCDVHMVIVWVRGGGDMAIKLGSQQGGSVVQYAAVDPSSKTAS